MNPSALREAVTGAAIVVGFFASVIAMCGLAKWMIDRDAPAVIVFGIYLLYVGVVVGLFLYVVATHAH